MYAYTYVCAILLWSILLWPRVYPQLYTTAEDGSEDSSKLQRLKEILSEGSGCRPGFRLPPALLQLAQPAASCNSCTGIHAGVTSCQRHASHSLQHITSSLPLLLLFPLPVPLLVNRRHQNNSSTAQRLGCSQQWGAHLQSLAAKKANEWALADKIGATRILVQTQ